MLREQMKKDNLLLLVIGLLPWSLWSVFYGVKVLPQLERTTDFVSRQGTELLAPQPKEAMLRVTVEQNDSNKNNVSIPKKHVVTLKHADAGDDAPLFVLQVGPSKTGTSTLQYFASENEKQLQNDSFWFLGNYRHNHEHPEWNLHKLCESCYVCQFDPNCQCLENWAAFEQNVNEHYEKGHNVLVIEEMFSNFLNPDNEQEYLWNKLIPLLSKWRVRIVFTYRRYYEWVPSAYFQAYNPGGTGTHKVKTAARSSWPHEGGKVIPTFDEYFGVQTKKMDRQPLGIISKWKERFPDVWVFNMNSGGDFMQTFFCKMVPEATQFCDNLKSNSESVTRNPSSTKNLHFDMLAMEAYNRGWLNTKDEKKKKLSRLEARTAVEAHSKKLGKASLQDFAQKCLSDEQIKLLLDRSLELEKTLVPAFYKSPQGEADLRAKFKEYQDSGRFCSVNVHKTFEEQGSWKKLFVDMKPSQNNNNEKAQGNADKNQGGSPKKATPSLRKNGGDKKKN